MFNIGDLFGFLGNSDLDALGGMQTTGANVPMGILGQIPAPDPGAGDLLGGILGPSQGGPSGIMQLLAGLKKMQPTAPAPSAAPPPMTAPVRPFQGQMFFDTPRMAPPRGMMMGRY